jgi:hypothetical protein
MTNTLNRVLRRLAPRARYNDPTGAEVHRSLFMDLETTGLDATRREITEFARYSCEVQKRTTVALDAGRRALRDAVLIRWRS